MSPTGPSRLGSSIAVLPAPVQSEPVKGTFLLCSKVTFSYCCDIYIVSKCKIRLWTLLNSSLTRYAKLFLADATPLAFKNRSTTTRWGAPLCFDGEYPPGKRH